MLASFAQFFFLATYITWNSIYFVHIYLYIFLNKTYTCINIKRDFTQMYTPF